MKRPVLNVLIALAIGTIGFTQDLHDWQVKSYMNDITGIEYAGGKIWASTTGGVLSFDVQDSSYRSYTNIDGLSSLKLTCVVKDTYERLVFGSADGQINLHDPKTGGWQYSTKLAGQYISGLHVTGDTLWVATAEGAGVFILNQNGLEFRDFYNNLPRRIGASSDITVFANRVYFGTNKGVLSAPSDFLANNLKIADAWQVADNSNFLPSDNVLGLRAIGDTLYIGTDLGVAWIAGDGTGDILGNWTRGYASDFAGINGILYIIRYSNYYKKQGNGFVFAGEPGLAIQDITVDSEQNLWMGLRRGGILKHNWQRPLLTPGPASNHVGVITRDKTGKFWISSGKLKIYFSDGFYIYDKNEWVNYKFRADDWYRKNQTVSVYRDRLGNIWMGTWGGGMFMYDGQQFNFFHNWRLDGFLTATFVDTVIDMPVSDADVAGHDCLGEAAVGVNDYSVVTDFAEDSEGNLWISSYGPSDGRYITVVPRDINGKLDIDCANWVTFGTNIGMSNDEGEVTTIEFDDFGRLWIGTFVDNSGILVFDFNHTIYDRSDDQVFRIQKGTDNLYSNVILDLKKDRDGVMWIGTDAGLNSYDGVNFYKHVGEIGPVENKINQIFVDSNNNKWFATDGGLSVLQGDKSPWDPAAWVQYTPENSGLPDPVVNSIYIDQNSGTAYIGTEGGLALFSGPFTEFRAGFDAVATGPNPFVIGRETPFYTIQNMMANSTVKILSLNGRLIRLLSGENGLVQGSRARWDGRDSEGKIVPSGIYVYLVYTHGGATASGKIAVIKP